MEPLSPSTNGSKTQRVGARVRSDSKGSSQGGGQEAQISGEASLQIRVVHIKGTHTIFNAVHYIKFRSKLECGSLLKTSSLTC